MSNQSQSTYHSMMIEPFSFTKQTERVTQAPSSLSTPWCAEKLSIKEPGNPQLLFDGRLVWIHLVLCEMNFFQHLGKKRKIVTATWQSGMLFKMWEEELGNKAESRIFLTVELMGGPFLLWKAAMLCTGWFSICTHSGVKGASILTAVVKNK